MIQETLMIITLVSIWISLFMSIFTLGGATAFWLKHSAKVVKITPLSRYPMITIAVPAHNEEVVIAQTTRAILDMNYPADRMELLLFADNCTDGTAAEMRRTLADPRYRNRNVRIIERTGSGGKAGVLNDALKMAHGDYIGVYDADAMPETNALYFLVRKALENPERYVAVFGRNKTRNAQQNFLTRCINQEIIVTQRIRHCAIWHLFKIGFIPGTNFIIQRQFVQEIGGWSDGALTEDTDISFKIMQRGKLIALAYNSEAFQQEPERVHDYYFQRLRWAKGNYQVIIHNLRHLFDHSNWRVKLEIFYYSCIFFWFNAAIVLSDIIFLANASYLIARFFDPALAIPFTFGESNILIMQVLLLNWLLMIILYILQISTAMATQFGQATTSQIWLALASYFTYSQLFILVSIHAVCSVSLDAILGRNGNVWVKTKRFDD
ncbi:glycosyltransferase family 2 protein [Limosilactobacillus reuteri]|uniref:glycosyltransferase family 2 protein n=1 Tax=Limosilactobacillus reuteri TaxID=1598 RepID=UPI0015538D98|nr:glycosyltransferase [Limosilactobacillus reuteri]